MQFSNLSIDSDLNRLFHNQHQLILQLMERMETPVREQWLAMEDLSSNQRFWRSRLLQLMHWNWQLFEQKQKLSCSEVFWPDPSMKPSLQLPPVAARPSEDWWLWWHLWWPLAFQSFDLTVAWINLFSNRPFSKCAVFVNFFFSSCIHFCRQDRYFGNDSCQ